VCDVIVARPWATLLFGPLDSELRTPFLGVLCEAMRSTVNNYHLKADKLDEVIEKVTEILKQ
jgi:hypothetical protein